MSDQKDLLPEALRCLHEAQKELSRLSGAYAARTLPSNGPIRIRLPQRTEVNEVNVAQAMLVLDDAIEGLDLLSGAIAPLRQDLADARTLIQNVLDADVRRRRDDESKSARR